MDNKLNTPDQLRKAAEARLAIKSELVSDNRTNQEILHELCVHQIQLEMQNEALRQTQIDLEESRDSYVELYDFAPVGYINLNHVGRIDKINLTAATLLGEDRNKLKNHYFNHFVAQDSQDNWYRHFLSVLKNNCPETFELTIKRKDGLTFYARLECARVETREIEPIVRVALSDISQSHLVSKALSESEARYRSFVENAADGIFVANSQGRYIEVNSEGCNMLGYSRDEILSRTIVDIIDPAEIPKLGSELARLAAGALVVSEWKFLCKDGSMFIGEVRGQQLPNGNLHAILIDITERKKVEEKLRIAAIAFESQEGMVITDIAGTILRANRAYSAITGYTSEEVIGKNPRIMQSGRQDKSFYDAMWKTILNTGCWEGEVWNNRKNGEVFPEHLMITAVKNDEGMTTNYVGTLTDITLSREATNEIEHLAFYDVLTRLPNRRLLMDRLNLALTASLRSGMEGALLFLDLDNFKTLNDTLGHETGDLLLQQAAQRIESTIREGDTVARLGGDEFVVMLENLSAQRMEAAAITEAIGAKVLNALNQTYQLGEHHYHCSTSIGATLFGDHKTEINELLKQADIAMYQAKKAGRNTLRFFDLQMQASINSRVALETQLRNAIENREFVLYYQVQVNHLRKALGAEALIRWQNTELGFISPAQFIPLAEETGLILPIGQWVLETACAQLKAWQNNAFTRELTLSVNVSSRQFHEANFVKQVQDSVRLYAINPALLKLEPTESVLLEDIDATVETMNALKAIGVHFALDDFGTGFSSLQYLKKLPLNQLKIDQTFVRDLVTDSNDQAIVRTIIAMAQSMNLQVIAEGVETEEQQKLLLQSGCKHYQGYLFGKPVPIAEFEASLKKK